MNSQSYAYHYRNVDSALAYAVRAYELSDGYSEGRAEACNNQAFVCIVRMQYNEAEKLLNEVLATSDNQVERMVAYVSVSVVRVTVSSMSIVSWPTRH